MPSATPAAVLKQIAAGDAAPVYLLLGEDEVEKAALAHAFEGLVDEGLRAFNVERVHASDITTGDRLASAVAAVVDAVRTLPMMSPRRVVIVFQADGLLVPRRESEAAARAMAELERLFVSPERQTTLVLVTRGIDRRSRMYKLLAKEATVVTCGLVENLEDAVAWIRNRVQAAGARIDATGARLLAERAGTDVKRLRNDVDRLLLYALGQQAIGLDDVREVVGPAALQDDWAMTNAIEAGDPGTALRQLALLLDSGAAPEKILGQLGWLVRARFPLQMPSAVKPAVQALFRTDLDLKRSAGDPRVLLERLVVELCTRTPGRQGSPAGARRY